MKRVEESGACECLRRAQVIQRTRHDRKRCVCSAKRWSFVASLVEEWENQLFDLWYTGSISRLAIRSPLSASPSRSPRTPRYRRFQSSPIMTHSTFPCGHFVPIFHRRHHCPTVLACLLGRLWLTLHQLHLRPLFARQWWSPLPPASLRQRCPLDPHPILLAPLLHDLLLRLAGFHRRTPNPHQGFHIGEADPGQCVGTEGVPRQSLSRGFLQRRYAPRRPCGPLMRRGSQK